MWYVYIITWLISYQPSYLPRKIHIMPETPISARVRYGCRGHDMDFEGRYEGWYEIKHVIIYLSYTWIIYSLLEMAYIWFWIYPWAGLIWVWGGLIWIFPYRPSKIHIGPCKLSIFRANIIQVCDKNIYCIYRRRCMDLQNSFQPIRALLSWKYDKY